MDALTIWDMLDRLEAGIGSLRSRNLELERGAQPDSGAAQIFSVSNEDSAPKKVPTSKKHKANSRPKKKKATPREKAAANSGRKRVSEKKLLTAAEQSTSEPVKPAVGKRQALGRSITQLRRLSSTGASNS